MARTTPERPKTRAHTKPVRRGTLARVRPMRLSDLGEVAAIEQRGYAFPWPRIYFRYCMKGGYECWVLEHGEVIQGYGVMAFERESAHILNICIRPESRRRGLGAQLLNYLLSLARECEVPSVTLEVNQLNRVARRLYRRAGFVKAGVRKGYYPGKQGPEDAVVMVRQLKS